MLALVACSAALLAIDPTPPPPEAARDYHEARRQAGHSPDDQVRLALWCEAHGLPAERLKHLAMAIMADPANAAARGLMGLVEHGGRWKRPEAVADAIRADPAAAATLAEYDGRRLKAAYTADAQWALGLWCEEHGLRDQAKAHLTAVTRLDPSRAAAWRRLGYKKHDGRWATDAQLAAEKADAEAQEQADKRWKPTLEKWKAQLAQPDRREEALAALSGVTDPRAVPSIVRVFVRGDRAADVTRAVQMLGQVDSARASKALASLAVSAGPAEARRTATEILRRRDPREFAKVLIGLFEAPIAYEVRPVAGPGSPGVLFVQGEEHNVRRLYSPPPAPSVAILPGDSPALDADGFPTIERSMIDGSESFLGGLGRSQALALAGADGHPIAPPTGPAASLSTALRVEQFRSKLAHAASARAARQIDEQLARMSDVPNPTLDAHEFVAEQVRVRIPVGRMMAEARKAALSAQEQLASDVAVLDRHNDAVRASNERVGQVLNSVTGLGLAAGAKAWNAWWVDLLGFRAQAITGATPERPTLIEDVPLAYTPQEVPIDVSVSTSGGTYFSPPSAPGGFVVLSKITGHYKRYTSCFGAGTPVRTVAGPRPIESLRVGDRVLTQSTATGALRYQPILAVHHNPPAATFRVRLGGEAIVSSHFHRFWVAGRGWVMARELKAGDAVRTLGGVQPVESVEPDSVQPVYNLDVAEDADFFAGAVGALVHDNTLPDPRLAPFDAPPAARAVAAAR